MVDDTTSSSELLRPQLLILVTRLRSDVSGRDHGRKTEPRQSTDEPSLQPDVQQTKQETSDSGQEETGQKDLIPTGNRAPGSGFSFVASTLEQVERRPGSCGSGSFGLDCFVCLTCRHPPFLLLFSRVRVHESRWNPQDQDRSAEHTQIQLMGNNVFN